ncbi:MAG: adenylate/guanylate cyclase domain-containing protein, partial [Solirubrobacteraceae bacterium]
MAQRAAQDLTGDPADVAFFDQLMVRHLPRAFMRVMRRLPAEPRCRLCNAPYGGLGGQIMRRFGFGPSRKNPTLCNTCVEKAPMGGVDREIGVLFADVRGVTALAERTPSDEVARLLN